MPKSTPLPYRITQNLDVRSKEGQELVALGNREMDITKGEMSALLALCEESRHSQPLKGARNLGPLPHDDPHSRFN